MQETWVWSLIREDPTCLRATKPMSHNYWACVLELGGHHYRAHVMQVLKPTCPRAHAPPEKPPQWESHSPQLEKSPCSNKDPAEPKLNRPKIYYKDTLQNIHQRIIYSLKRENICLFNLSSPTRDQTHTTCIRSTESYPLDFQGSLQELRN